jgi:aminopeptidase
MVQRTTSAISGIAFLSTSIVLGSSCLTAQEPDFDSIAEKIVNHSLEVKPGESVIINGTPAELDLLEALVVASSKAGGKPTVQVTFPAANKRVLAETAIEYLKLTDFYNLMQTRLADCIINTSSTQDPTLFADIPEERFAAQREAGRAANEATRSAHFRSVTVGQIGGIPSRAYAESVSADYEKMISMFWKAVDADYDQLLSSAERITSAFRPGSKVTLTTEAGTDLWFTIGDIPPRVNAARTADVQGPGVASVWLPAGEAYVCVDPTSASGTVVVPSTRFRGVPVSNMRLIFEKGRITSLEAEENGEMLREFLEATTGDSGVLAVVDVGVNPHSQHLPGSEYSSWEMAGMVTIVTGYTAWAGCEVVADGGLTLPQNGATLSIDGKTVVNDGTLEAGM